MMIFSRSQIEQLVLQNAEARLNVEALSELIYNLSLSGKFVPTTIAETLAERPRLLGTRSRIPGRLAYGIVDRCMLRTDIDVPPLRKLCNQVEYVRIELLKLERSAHVIDIFSERLDDILLTAAATRDMADDREFCNAELASLVESIIVAMMKQRELISRLTKRVVRMLHRSERRRLLEKVKNSVEEGLSNSPWDDTAENLSLCFDLSEPIRFRRTLYNNPYFIQTAKQLPETVANA